MGVLRDPTPPPPAPEPGRPLPIRRVLRVLVVDSCPRPRLRPSPAGRGVREGEVRLKLAKHEHIITAWPEYCSGPGWSNALIWVLIRNRQDNSLRQEAIQPQDRTRGMCTLFDVCASAHSALLAEVVEMVAKRGRRRK